jgi:DNA-binding HxlR family transcriptional regulator
MKKDAPCILDQTNASRKTLDLIADKWTILVLFALRHGKRRFAELRREIHGVTEKMLIQTLRNLERDGIVARKVYPTVPPKVEDSISELGWSLAPILDAIIDWSYGESGEGLCGPRGVRKEESPRENSFCKDFVRSRVRELTRQHHHRLANPLRS